jgi:hypothetical protein
MRRNIAIPAGGTFFTVGDDDDHFSFLSMVEALEGDTRRLDARFQSGVVLSQNERDFLAKKKKRVRHRPPKRSTDSLHWKIAWLVYYCRQLGKRTPGKWPPKAAIAEAMTVFGVSRRTVFEAIGQVNKEPGRQMLLEESMRDAVFSEAGLDELKRGLKYRCETSITWAKE